MALSTITTDEIAEALAQKERLAPLAQLLGIDFAAAEGDYGLMHALDRIDRARREGANTQAAPVASSTSGGDVGPMTLRARELKSAWKKQAVPVPAQQSADDVGLTVLNAMRARRGLALVGTEDER